MAAIVYIFAALFACVAAKQEVFIDGKCPDYKLEENFNVASYAGKWYEYGRFFNKDEVEGNCATAEYTPKDDGVIVKNTNVVHETQTFIEGSAKVDPEANGAGRLLVTFTFAGHARTSPLGILKTDYTKYAVAVSCKHDETTNKSRVTAWVLSRSPKLEDDTKKTVEEVFKSNNLDFTQLIITDHSEEACKFTKTVEITTPNTA